MKLNEAQAEAIYDLLVEHGATDDPGDRRFFVSYVTDRNERWDFEYRFMGQFGFGGKLYEGGPVPLVDQYREDETPESKAAIAALNERIAEAFHKHATQETA